MERPDDDFGGIAAFVRSWDTALRTACYVPLTPAQRRQLLADLARRFAAVLTGDDHTTAAPDGAGYRIGLDLVAAGFAAPEALGRSVTLIHSELLHQLGLSAEALRGRLAQVLEGFVAGFAWAVHDRALTAQEEVRLAALTAQARAEDELRSSEARYRHLATHDALTGLPNWRLFTERVSDFVTRAPAGARLGVCCVGLDGFTSVNDSLGRQIGDQLLVAVATRLSQLVGEGCQLAARLEGDQFGLLLAPSGCSEETVKVADRVLALLAAPFDVAGGELPLTASAGVVDRAAAQADPVELIRSAQIALHWAKADGKARWQMYHPSRSEQDRARYQLSAAMPAALRRGEFILDYQPLVHLADRRLVGMEALARWRHPERGLLSAGRFIGLAADTGLVVPLGYYLMEQACREAARWGDYCSDPPFVSVNLAVRQLRHPGLVGDVQAILDRTGLPPGRLQLEITEDATIDLDSGVDATLQGLVRLGIRLAVDDFGTGYSNLSYLRTLPLHDLKLDATFARLPSSVEGSAEDEAFLAAVADLAHTRGLTVTAEGIETEQQAVRMHGIGCDTGQGWHLGLPAPAEDLPALLGRQG